MKVTAETITDEQIWELKRQAEHGPVFDVRLATDCSGALIHRPTSPTGALLRERCAAAWNARHGGTP